MRTFKPILTSFLVIAIFSGSSLVFAETAQKQDGAAHHAHRGNEWPGVYNGFTPCADCVGVKTSLALNANNSYILITQYAGKSPRDFTEKGKFTWSEDGSKIVLTPRDGSAVHHYLVGDGMLTQLDGNGNRISGKDADRYVLRRNDVTAQEPKHSH
ncbi:MAG: copper resistance protein NlpE [Methylomonas sp.]